jgi:hypothetical protein
MTRAVCHSFFLTQNGTLTDCAYCATNLNVAFLIRQRQHRTSRALLTEQLEGETFHSQTISHSLEDSQFKDDLLHKLNMTALIITYTCMYSIHS